MKTKTKPWQKDNSIFQYVKQHIDEDGFFVGENLPMGEYSFISPAVGLELGAGDAFVIMSTDDDDTRMTDVVYQATKEYLHAPTEKNRDNLYQLVAFSQCIAYCGSLVERLSKEKLPTSLLALAEEWLYEASSRETVKFAIVICGLFGLNSSTQKKHKSIKKDLRLLACCDEFTYFIIFAFRLSNIENELDLWKVIKTTYGWGRVHAMEAIEYNTPEEKDWLLRHGCELDVPYPAISLICIKDGNMLAMLQKPSIDEELYQGILNALNNYLEFLLDYDSNNDNYPNLAILNTFSLLKELLRHAEHFSDSIEDMIGIVNLAGSLHKLADENRWETLDANNCHVLISLVEKLIYSKDRLPEIKTELVNSEGNINFLVADFAYALKIDIWDMLAALLRANPQISKLYMYLLDTDDDNRYMEILDFARQHLYLYTEDEHALQPILKSLEAHPGTGEDFLIPALTSLYDWPRSCALDVIDAWGIEYLTPPLRAALLKANALAQHTLLSLRIKFLLENKIFDLESAVKILSLE